MKTMMVLSLFLFMGPRQLPEMVCPQWLPGTNQILPPGINLTPEQQLQNTIRCYCEVIKAHERECMRNGMLPSMCRQRTADWVRENLRMIRPSEALINVPRRNVLINER